MYSLWVPMFSHCGDVEVVKRYLEAPGMLDFMTRRIESCDGIEVNRMPAGNYLEVAGGAGLDEDGVKAEDRSISESRSVLESRCTENLMDMIHRIESIERLALTKYGKKRVRTVAELNENIEALTEIREKVRRKTSAILEELADLQIQREKITNIRGTQTSRCSTKVHAESSLGRSEKTERRVVGQPAEQQPFEEEDYVPF